MTSAELGRRKQQTERARETFASRFATPEEKSTYYSQIGKQAAKNRVVISPDDAAAIGQAFRLLRRVAERVDLSQFVDKEEEAAALPAA